MTPRITSPQKKQIGRVMSDALDAADLTKDGAQRLLGSSRFRSDLQALVLHHSVAEASQPTSTTPQPPPTSEPTIVSYGEMEVDFTQPLAAMIATGGYNYVNPNIIQERFPHRGNGKVAHEAVTVGFGRQMKTAQVKAELKRLGIEPWGMAELCTFGVKHPDVQRERPVVATGQHWLSLDRYRRCGVLDRNGSGRDLGLGWGDGSDEWSERCVFGGFRKLPAV